MLHIVSHVRESESTFHRIAIFVTGASLTTGHDWRQIDWRYHTKFTVGFWNLNWHLFLLWICNPKKLFSYQPLWTVLNVVTFWSQFLTPIKIGLLCGQGFAPRMTSLTPHPLLMSLLSGNAGLRAVIDVRTVTPCFCVYCLHWFTYFCVCVPVLYHSGNFPRRYLLRFYISTL